MTKGYTIAPDGSSIICHRCGRRSFHRMDVAHRYCGFCKLFHEDDQMAIDYKNLLWKYMNLVGREEGVVYVGRIHRGVDADFAGDEFFTREEYLALREIEDMPHIEPTTKT